jgi:pilus assembly protein CpaB
MRDKIILGLSLLVGVLAFVLTHQYLKSERDRLYAGAEKITVIVAKRDLPAGTVLETGDLALNAVFKKAVGANVFRADDLNLLLNKKLLFSLKRADPVLWSHVERPQDRAGGLAPMIKSGLRAISITAGGDAAVSGHVKPNDRVDIIGTFTFPSRDNPGEMESVTLTVLQDVTVLATGRELARQDDLGREIRSMQATGYSTVTLEVTPREAELLVFAQHVKGQLKLSLFRSGSGTDERVVSQVRGNQCVLRSENKRRFARRPADARR